MTVPPFSGTVEQALELASSTYWQPAERARAAADFLAGSAEPALRGIALVAEGLLEVRRGDVDAAFGTLERAQAEADRCDSPQLNAMLAAANARLSFFSGAYHAALSLSDDAIAIAGTLPAGPIHLDVLFARTLVLDNVLPGRLDAEVVELVETARMLGSAAAEAVAYNDLACALLRRDRRDDALDAANEAVQRADEIGADGALAQSFAYSTRAEVQLALHDPIAALADLAVAQANPELRNEPYLAAMTAHLVSQALAADGCTDAALATAQEALDRLGTRLPLVRTLLLHQTGACLRASGRHEEAYTALERASELERSTALELSLRHHELQQAALETHAARRHAAERARLLARTVEVAEDERIRVAIELHDGPIQRLTVVTLKLDRLTRLMARGELEAVGLLAGEIRDELAGEMVSLRRLMTELRPPVIDERGLAFALADCAERVLGGTNVAVELRCTLGDVRPARQAETVVYRVTREALTNVVRHAQASRVLIALEAVDGLCRLVVEDDGQGFDVAAVARGDDRYGIAGMRERVESLEGKLYVHTAPGSGTRIEAMLPTA